ncbi:MAG: sulfatase-like hydrolase/transferase [Pseudomonadota bacterium]
MSKAQPNILFIMADQLRADYLGCTGHPAIRTPNIDGIAARGVNFSRAYVQAPVCGGSRMSFYTGRYAFSHGAYYNNYPLRIDECTIGDYLRPLGYCVALAGKTHVKHDRATFERLGVDADEGAGLLARQGGFEPWERDDGLQPAPAFDPDATYNRYLWDLGYNAENPWQDIANSAEGPDGEVLSGWLMRNARLPARVKAEHSETAFMTDRAMAFIEDVGDDPWCLHLSYIKPHWPYIAPDPWHAMYDANDVSPANRDDAERVEPNPVYAAFMNHPESQCFAREDVRRTVIPTYMGLITEIDHHVGRLVDFLRTKGLAEDTIVVVTSDHGDYLGDHWLGEKDLFHEESVRIPLIVADPRSTADATRGTIDDTLVEAIDLAASFLDIAGGEPAPHRLEGRSLMPLLGGERSGDWRDAVFCDSCFAMREARLDLGLEPQDARGYMVRTRDWKYVLFEKNPPMLFDLTTDPHELNDLGRDPGHDRVRADMHERLFDWTRHRRLRTTIPDDVIAANTGRAHERGYLFGVW